MRRLGFLLALLLVSCAAPQPSVTTVDSPDPTPPPSVATTAPGPVLEVDDCTTPTITFSALCEIYALTQEWHVDRPVDPGRLAEIATTALEEVVVAVPQQVPDFLQCSIPDPAFSGFCDTLAMVMRDTGATATELVASAVAGLVELGLGPFNIYVPPDEVTQVRDDGVVGGVGLVLDARDAVGSPCARLSPVCPLTIVYVLEGAPGETAGLLAEDQIVAVDGAEVDDQGFAAVSRLIAGDETGTVSLTVERGDRVLVFEIVRAPVAAPSVEIDVPRPGVGYLRVPDFESDIPALVREALQTMDPHSPDLIVVDLRDNGGGFVASALAVASEFITDGPIVTLATPSESVTEEAFGDAIAASPRLVVLVNRGTASAAEILAAALRDRREAVLVGETTFGKDAVQIPFDLRNGGRLDLVVARWASPSGATVAGAGLSPDVEAALGATLTIEELVDTVLALLS